MGSVGAEVPLNPDRSPSRDTLTRFSRSNLQSYVWMTNDSMLSRDVDRWIAGDTGSPTHAALQPTDSYFRVEDILPPRRPAPAPGGPAPAPARGSPAPAPLLSSGFWYVAAMVLPLLSCNGATARNWRCSPSALINTAEVLLTQVSGFCGRARSRLRRAAADHGARDLFAGAMDVVLVVYAFGFLLISLYQASVFHQFD